MTFRSKSSVTPPACLLFSQKHPSLTPSTPQPFHFSFSDSQPPLCLFRDDPCMLVGRQILMNRQANSLSLILFFSVFFSHVRTHTNKQANRQTQVPAVPVIPVTFLISSELFSMPAVKRFSVSFARHPTNGMSAFIQVYFDTPPVFPVILHDLFVGKHFLCFLFLGVWRLVALITLNVSKIEIFKNWKSFCFTTHPLCLLYLVLFLALTSNTTCSACTCLICLSDPAVSSQDGWMCLMWNISIYHTDYYIDIFPCVDDHTS